ncbi:AsmA family protein [Alcaligenaceae bacterium C4P045]|nr:AsmA family protein [Alcaligenaceae bacterium C4P045]
MKTWIKRILIGLVVLVLVAIVGLAIFLLTFDPNAYKYKLEELIQTRYQRTLAIEGDIELSLFPRLGLSLQDVSLSEVNSEDTFASVESARLAVAIWPLLSDNLVVDHVAVTGFKARVIRDKTGQFNFSNLVGADNHMSQSASADAPRDQNSGFQIDIAGMDLQQGDLVLQDQITGRAITINRLNASTGRITFNQPFNVNLNAHLEGGNPRMDANLTGQGMLMLNPAAKEYSAQKLDMRITGQLPDAQATSLIARGNVAFNGQTSSLNVAGLELLFQGDVTRPDLAMKGVDASVSIPRLVADPFKRKLQIDRLAVRARGAMERGPFELALDAPSLNISPEKATGDALTGRLRLDGPSGIDTNFGLTGISGNAAELDIQEAKLNGTLKQNDRLVKFAFTSPVSLGLSERTASMPALRGDVNITDPALPKGNLQIPVIGSLNADLVKDQAAAKINAVLEGGKFDLTADVARLSEAPRLAFSLAVDVLDLDKLVPQASAAPASTAKPASAPAPTPAPAATPAPAPSPAATSSPTPATAPDAAAANATAPANGAAPAAGANPAAAAPAQASTSASAATPAPAAAPAPATTPAPAPAAPAAAPTPAPAAPTPSVDDTIDLRALVGPTASGSVKVGKLVVRGMKADDVSADIKLEKGKLDISSLAATLYEGKLAGVVSVNAAENNKVAAKLSLAGISIEPLLNDLTRRTSLSGKGSVVLDLTSSGANTYAMTNNLAGTLQARLRDGAVKGINIAQTLRELKRVVTGEVSPAVGVTTGDAQQTDFTALDADVQFDRGIGTVKNLNLSSPLLRISQGSPATFNLVTRVVDFVALIRVVNTLTGQDGEGLEELRNVTVPIHVAGPFEKPLFAVQWRGAAEELLKGRAEDKLREVIEKNTGASPEAAKDIGNALKGLLKR